MRWLRLLARPVPAQGVVSASETELFGGPLRWDMGWTQHEYARLQMTLLGTLCSLPRLVGTVLRLAWAADRRALLTIAVTETGQGLAGALSYLAVTGLLRHLFAAGPVEARLHAAEPALAAVAVIATVNAVLASLSTSATGRLEPKIERRVSELYLSGAAQVELAAVEDAAFQRLVDVAQFSAAEARRMVSSWVATVNGLFSLGAVASVLTVLHPVLLPMLLLIVLPRGWGAMRVSQRRYVSQMQWVEHTRAERVLGQLLTSRSAAQEVRVHGVGAFILRHFRLMAQAAETEQTRLARDKAMTELLAAALGGLASLATYSTLLALILTGKVEIAVGATAVLAIRSGTASLGGLVQNINNMHEQSLYVADLDRFLDEARRRAIPESGQDLPDTAGHVLLDEVTFTYPGRDAPALDGVSLEIPAGQVVALVGENGSGKSTLVKLLAGLHLPDTGRIEWNGVDVAAADRHQVFARISLLNQEFERWPFTAATNIAIGQPDRTPDPRRLEEAAAYAGADTVVASLPDGMSTLLARQFRRGAELSGGQWQKVGLARSAFRQARLVIADEPTSALDPAAEIASFERIRAMADQDTTVVLVTHRMAAVRHADQIFVLHDGRLVEHGDHESLMKHQGRYAAMYRIQADQYSADRAARIPGQPSADTPASTS
ncbi:ABC transporter ATP-binding protein [Streptacidiphilus melanogenes]|uniref:ABC transporter ATP-binding protein n=1 Tax=Streptacidiphilus melanogenes TaxID=411235 RepID=UPI0005A9811B|nr:ABC transporter ATP-binding protein [Streptacidiphilus melanogenes]